MASILLSSANTKQRKGPAKPDEMNQIMRTTPPRGKIDQRLWIAIGAIFLYGNALAQDVPVALLPGSASTPSTLQANLAQNPPVAAPKGSVGEAGQWSGYANVEATAINGNPELALKQLDRRLAVASNDARAAYLKGLILMQMGESEQAERWFKMMQSNFPDLAQPYNALAVIYHGRGDLLSAQNVLEASLAQHPDNRIAQINLADIYLELARKNYDMALKMQPDDAKIAAKLKALEALN